MLILPGDPTCFPTFFCSRKTAFCVPRTTLLSSPRAIPTSPSRRPFASTSSRSPRRSKARFSGPSKSPKVYIECLNNTMLVIGAKKASSSSSKKEGLSRFRRRRSWSRRSKETKRFDEFDHIGNKKRIERYENWICIKQQRAFFFGLKKRNTTNNNNNRGTHLPGDRVVEILRLPRERTRDDHRKSREYYYGASKHHHRVFGHFSL